MRRPAPRWFTADPAEISDAEGAARRLLERATMPTRDLRFLPLALLPLALAEARCSAPVDAPTASSRQDVGAGQTGVIHPVATSSLCLDTSGESSTNGTPVVVAACNGGASQSWTYDGTSLRVFGTKCLDVTNGSTTDGNKLQIWDCFQGNTNQMWTSSGERFLWTNQNKCLDLTDGVTQPGTLAQSWTCTTGDANQEWSFGTATSAPAPDAGSTPPTPPTAPPSFGPNVLIFDPTMATSSIQSTLDGVYASQDAAQFGTGRYAFFFKPGTYALDVKVGFYTEVLGLGASPDDVSIQGAVRAKADWLGSQNATCNFWRGAENLAVTPEASIDNGTNVWAVSQGTHLRRVHVAGNLALDDGGWSSGGFIADSLIDGTINSGTQQQFLTRNNDQNWQGSNWNMVFVGDGNAPNASWPAPPYTVQGSTPKVREKPFLTIDSSGNYAVVVPGMKASSVGHDWPGASGTSLPISAFTIAQPGDSAASLNAALAQGQNLLFTPGIYDLDSPIQITRANTVVLGLGLATFIPTSGQPLFQVADVDGVTLAGLLLEAGPTSSSTLLQVGPSVTGTDHSADPTMLFDVHCRVGGADVGTAASCVTLNSDDTIVDNAWLWRADHGAGASWTGNPSANGLIVNGDDVTIYGLFVEHFQQYQTLWNGNGGSVYFYQSEMPYDPPNQGAWEASSGHDGYPSYKVADGVTTHFAEGLGVYSVFTNDVSAVNAIETPTASGVSMSHMMTVSLASGTIQHIVNGTGGTVGNGNMTAFSSY